MKFSVDQIKQVPLFHHDDGKGDLVVMENGTHVPFTIARVFAVRASSGTVRGEHAHKMCTQFLVALNGRIEVLCDDGAKKAVYMLDRPEKGLLIPPGIWVRCSYLAPDSVLNVLCDRPYEAHDYIRDYNEFKVFRQAA